MKRKKKSQINYNLNNKTNFLITNNRYNKINSISFNSIKVLQTIKILLLKIFHNKFKIKILVILLNNLNSYKIFSNYNNFNREENSHNKQIFILNKINSNLAGISLNRNNRILMDMLKIFNSLRN